MLPEVSANQNNHRRTSPRDLLVPGPRGAVARHVLLSSEPGGTIASIDLPLPQRSNCHRHDVTHIDRILIDFTSLGQDLRRVKNRYVTSQQSESGRQMTLRSISTVSSRISLLATSEKIFLVLYAFIAE